MRIGLISDTHGKLRNEVFGAFSEVDLILHAGDIGSPDIITELATLAPVRAVYGNTDGFDLRHSYPIQLDLIEEGKRIRVLHGHLLGSPTPASLRAHNPDVDVIVYGHTHQPLLDQGTPLVVNPGAAGPARFKLSPSVAILTVPELEVRFVEL